MPSAHGTISRYNNQRCRCPACAAAWAEYSTARHRQRKAYTAANGLPGSVAHGVSAYVNWGCRCDRCTTAATEYKRAYR